MTKIRFFIYTMLVSVLSAIASLYMRSSTMEIRIQELESSIEFDNATALALDVIIFPFLILAVHLICHLILFFITVFPKKYHSRKVNLKSIFRFSKSMTVNLFKLLFIAIAMWLFVPILINAYYPLWCKFVVLISVSGYLIWLLQIVNERVVHK